MIVSIIFAFVATFGISLVFHVPFRHTPVAALVGAMGYLVNLLCLDSGTSELLACFLAACGIGLFSDVAARVCKEASTVFIIPGLLCLVPGVGMYQTMYAIVTDELSRAVDVGVHTLFLAGAIALGLLVMGGVIRTVVAILRRSTLAK